jgi:hypothetical protein
MVFCTSYYRSQNHQRFSFNVMKELLERLQICCRIQYLSFNQPRVATIEGEMGR